MYPGKYAAQLANKPCFIMAGSGETVTYAELDARANRVAHLFRANGLKRLDHYSIFMENNSRYVEICAAGERSGLHYTCISSYLGPEEVAYIINNSESKVLVTSRAMRKVAMESIGKCPNVELCLIVDGTGDDGPFQDYATAVAAYSDRPIQDERIGAPMLYTSGTTGRPKGILRHLDDVSPEQPLPAAAFLSKLWQYRDGMVYLSPAPLYHSAPQMAVGLTLRAGGTAVIMDRFDPETFLQLVEKHHVTHSQLVPTMFGRMLKLSETTRLRYDLSSLEVIVHAAAPCPEQMKRDMMDWLGPIILEYYGATESIGFAACDSHEWLAHPGTVGKVVRGDLHVLDDAMEECPPGTPGTLWFTCPPVAYFNDPEKSREARSPDGTMNTVGDIGYLDEAGYLYLTDRTTFMIISGGVNIYPQECENVLVTHPKVADAAVIGVPNEDLGEEVKAVVQVMPDVAYGEALAAELISYCRERLSPQKCPRSVDFCDELPRLPTGKLYKLHLRNRYWEKSRTGLSNGPEQADPKP